MTQTLEGLTVIYDVIKKGVFIEYQGKTDYLEGPFPTRNQAITEAERFCRSLRREPDLPDDPAEPLSS